MAGLRWQNIEMPLGGADQYTDAPHVLPGKMRELENIRLRRPPTHSKRYGVQVLGTDFVDGSDTVSNARRLTGALKESIVFNDRYLFTYANTADAWAPRGDVSQCFVERRSVWTDLATYEDWDGAWNQNIYVFAHAAGGTATNIVVVDTTTDTVVHTQALNTGGSTRLRVIAVGDYTYLVIAGSYSRIDVTSGNYTFPAAAAFSGLAGSPAATPLFDCWPLADTHIVLAYAKAASGDVTIDRIAISNHTADATNTVAEKPRQTIAVHATSGEGVLVVWDDAGVNLRGWSLSTALVQVVAPFDIGATETAKNAGIARVSATVRCAVWRSDNASPNYDTTMYRTVALASGATGTLREVDDVIPASKPFAHDGRVFGWTTYPSEGGLGSAVEPVGGDQETLFLLEYTDAASAAQVPPIYVAVAARGIAQGVVDENFLPLVSHLGSGRYENAQHIKFKFDFAGDADQPIILSRDRVERLRADFEATRQHMTAQWGGALFIAGGRPSWYDGVTCTDLGFAWRPENISAVANVTGSLAAGDYNVACCYEWQDALGNIHRSAPSEILGPITVTANDVIDIEIQETLLTNRAITTVPGLGTFPAVKCVGYRSIVGPGPTLYRAGPIFGVDADRGTTLSLGDGIIDAATDAEIALRELLYTSGGILENSGPPPCKLVVAHADRLWLGGLEDPYTVYFSQPFVSGEGPRFNDTLALRFPFEVKAISGMDAKFIAFGLDQISATAGQGPPATGGLDIGFEIYDVPTDVGCIEPRSVVVYRDGVLFQSRKGIYQLGRDLSVSFIGAAVKGYLDTYPIVASAVELADRSEVIFGIQNSEGTSKRLVFNYEVQEWSLDTCPRTEISAAVIYNASTDAYNYAYCISAGDVAREAVGSYVNHVVSGDAFITSKWVTPWLKLNTLQDWICVEGVTLLGKQVGDAGVRVRVGFDYEESTWAETHTFTGAEVAAALVNGRMQLEVQFARISCEAVRIEIIDTSVDAVPTAGIELQSLVFSGGFQADGRNRVDREINRK